MKKIILIMGLLSFLFGCKTSEPYYKKNGVWFFKTSRVLTKDPVHFIPIDDVFAKDGLSGYYRGEEIIGSTGAHFMALDTHYAKDAEKVYYCDTYRKGQEYYLYRYNSIYIIDGAEPNSFQLIKDGYAKDGLHAFFRGKSFYVKNLPSFEVLEFNFCRDKICGYFNRMSIKNSDGMSFKVLSNYYAKDNRHVYFVSSFFKNQQDYVSLLKNADQASFQVLDTFYAKDKNTVYYNDSLINANPKTFKIIQGKEYNATDGVRNYIDGKVVK